MGSARTSQLQSPSSEASNAPSNCAVIDDELEKLKSQLDQL
ncbi:hypothetical protein [Leptolyngbya sp. FACHB-671]|nr:hypothetical protein [Leptolyngbya sp. FACHB-671]